MTDSTLASLSRALGPKYEVRRLIGSGGFAEVYEVWDKDLERRLAVKVLRPDVAWTSGMIGRSQSRPGVGSLLARRRTLPDGDGRATVRRRLVAADRRQTHRRSAARRVGRECKSAARIVGCDSAAAAEAAEGSVPLGGRGDCGARERQAAEHIEV